ncbi:MAG: aspartate carbamoyltransferase [Deltaproteobacteria bacterium]|nr:aspartate carbamoyltransferase [Deltaproteobacteria bacterium]
MTTYRPPEVRPASPHLPFGDRRDAPWYGRSIISVRQFGQADLAYVFGVAREMREMVARIGSFDLLKGKILANLFYEPSTRTASSFMAAMQRLGGTVIPINEVRYSSVSKGESLPDTIRTLEAYSDCIVLRHPQSGSAEEAARVAKKPIINAGDGVGEHPTQALLDLFTILMELGARDGRPDVGAPAGINGLTITMLGDLRYGRTVHSLARLASLYDVTLNFVSPDLLKMPREILGELELAGVRHREGDRLEPFIAETDVLYVTRVQKERFEDEAAYNSVKDAYVIRPESLAQAKDRMIVMHPFPRVGEIARELDDDPRAAYFRQMENGMYVRMALLAIVLGKA